MMKKLAYLFIATLIYATGCKEDTLDLYQSQNSIYFPGERVSNVYRPIDSSFFSYGYISELIQDTLLMVPVTTTGAKAATDRGYNLEILPSSTMVEGEDYEIENATFQIKAQQLRDTIRIRLKRSKSLQTEKRILNLALRANENFALQMESQMIGTGDQQQIRYFNRFSVIADDIVGPPWFWDESRNKYAYLTVNYLGAYSQKKFQLLIGVLNLDINEITKEVMPGNSLPAWGYGLQAYLNDMTAKGTPILEDDGTAMKMGKNVQ